MKLEINLDEQKLRAVRVQFVETDDAVILRRGCAEFKVQGVRAAEVVCTILATAGTEGASRSQIVGQFSETDRRALNELVAKLEARHFLVAIDTEFESPTSETSLDVFYWNFESSTRTVQKNLASVKVCILGVNSVSRSIASTLSEVGFESLEVVDYRLLCNLRHFDDAGILDVKEWPETCPQPVAYESWAANSTLSEIDCLVATSDFGGLHLMREWNNLCVEGECRFLPVVLQGLIGYLGPLVIPRETACFECLRARQNSHMGDPEAARVSEASAFLGQSVSGFHPSMPSMLGSLAAFEVERFFAGWAPSRLPGHLFEFNFLATDLSVRRVLKIPRCPVCCQTNTRSSIAVDNSGVMPVHEGNV